MTTHRTAAGPVAPARARARARAAQADLDALEDLVEAWGLDSFPASDPPANW